jgi:dUTP pyrophosphatase
MRGARNLLRNDRVTVKFNSVGDKQVVFPEYGTPLSAGFDLAAVDHIFLQPDEAKPFRTGLVIQAPEDHMLLITPRSSTFKKWGVSLGNTIGIVDEDFCGPEDELRLYVHNVSPLAVQIPARTRIAQGIFVPITRADFEIVDGPIAKTRGGWGSTGD